MTERSGDRSPSVPRLLVLGVRRGTLVALALAGAAEALALLVWAFGDTGISISDALALGGLELGAVHHVAIRLEIRDLVTSAASRIDLTVGVALLSLTAVAAWALERVGRRSAELVARGPMRRRLAVGAGIAAGYAAPLALLLPLVEVETGRPSAEALRGVFGLSLVPWQALLFPWVLSITAVAVGLVRAALVEGSRRFDGAGPRPAVRSAGTLEAALAGAGRMVLAAFALAFAGLFAGGIVAPDAAIALTTPTTARYVRAIADRPVAGAVLAVHHVAVAPAEATWVVVPSMGGCVRATGSFDGDVLCYGRYPVAISPDPNGEGGLETPFGIIAFERAPPGYLAFLLVPLLATMAGGIRAGHDTDARREGAVRGALAGVGFALAIAAVAVVSTATVRYSSNVSGSTTSGSFAIGPDPCAALVLGAAWGVVGGAAGGALSRSVRARARATRAAPGGSRSG